MQQKLPGKSIYIVLVIAFGIALFLFRPAGLFFLNDDLIHVPLSAQGVMGQRNSVRLFNDFSIYIDSLLYSKSATGYHVSNLLFHLLSCIALYSFIRLLQRRKIVDVSPGIALISSLLFFTYPFHSESIFWIIGRGSSISALLLMLAFYAYVCKYKNVMAGIIALMAFIIALFTYESVWCFFIPLFLLSWQQAKSKAGAVKKEIVWLLIWLLCFVAFLVYRSNAIGSTYGQYEWNAVEGNVYALMLGNFLKLILRTVAPPMQSSTLFLALSLLLLIILTIAIFITYKKNKATRSWISALLLCYFTSLVPYLSLGIDTHGTESERYLYLPSIFICVLLATVIANIKATNARLVCTTAVASYFICFLWVASNNYRLASSIVSNTFKALQQAPNKKYAVVQNIPRDYKGAVILRLGLREGWQWLKEKPLPDSIIITNYNENDRLFEQSMLKQNLLQKDIVFSSYYNANDSLVTGNFFLSKEDAILISYDKDGVVAFK